MLKSSLRTPWRIAFRLSTVSGVNYAASARIRTLNAVRVKKMSFQNLELVRTTFLDLLGIDLSAEVAPEEWDAAAIGFQKRHLVAHKLGVVDQEYITKTGDIRAVVGRKICIGADEVRGVARVISTLTPRLSDTLQKLRTSL